LVEAGKLSIVKAVSRSRELFLFVVSRSDDPRGRFREIGN
jgi:hypothetical protein